MTRARRSSTKGSLEAMIAGARAAGADKRAKLHRLLAVVREARHDDRRVLDAGRALERIVAERLHFVAGYPSLHAMLAERAGVSRTTAHRWRSIARAVERGALPPTEAPMVRAAYDAVRPGTKAKRPVIDRAMRTRMARARRALARRGVHGATFTLARRAGRVIVVIELPFDELDALAP